MPKSHGGSGQAGEGRVEYGRCVDWQEQKLRPSGLSWSQLQQFLPSSVNHSSGEWLVLSISECRTNINPPVQGGKGEMWSALSVSALPKTFVDMQDLDVHSPDNPCYSQ